MNLAGKRVDLLQLRDEGIAAGVSLPQALGIAGDQLVTYSADGAIIEPPAALAAVLEAHTPPPVPLVPNFGSDAADIDRQAAAAVTQLRQFIANATPTNAEVVANDKLQNRVLLALIRRQGL